MSDYTFEWMGQKIPFHDGESVAAALDAAGILHFGHDALGQAGRYFCGIGACQCCVVRINGVAREACITPARMDMKIEPMEKAHG